MEGSKKEKETEKMEGRGISIKKENHHLFRVYNVPNTLYAKLFFVTFNIHNSHRRWVSKLVPHQ